MEFRDDREDGTPRRKSPLIPHTRRQSDVPRPHEGYRMSAIMASDEPQPASKPCDRLLYASEVRRLARVTFAPVMNDDEPLPGKYVPTARMQLQTRRSVVSDLQRACASGAPEMVSTAWAAPPNNGQPKDETRNSALKRGLTHVSVFVPGRRTGNWKTTGRALVMTKWQ